MKLKIQLLLAIGLMSFISCTPRTASDETNSESTQKDTATTAVVDNRNSEDFKTFIETFLGECYFKHNIDSLLYNNSPVIAKYIKTDIGVERFYNPGAFCVKFSKKDQYNYNQAETKKWGGNNTILLSNFINSEPNDGFCEQSSSKDGVYYTAVTEFPSTADVETGNSVPTKIKGDKSWPKMKVVILSKKWITKQLYFLQIDKIWYLAFLYDCDCSA